jgi:hypothetical protein
MKFTLTYDGDLPAQAAARSSRTSGIFGGRSIRSLPNFWQTHPVLKRMTHGSWVPAKRGFWNVEQHHRIG